MLPGHFTQVIVTWDPRHTCQRLWSPRVQPPSWRLCLCPWWGNILTESTTGTGCKIVTCAWGTWHAWCHLGRKEPQRSWTFQLQSHRDIRWGIRIRPKKGKINASSTNQVTWADLWYWSTSLLIVGLLMCLKHLVLEIPDNLPDLNIISSQKKYYQNIIAWTTTW